MTIRAKLILSAALLTAVAATTVTADAHGWYRFGGPIGYGYGHGHGYGYGYGYGYAPAPGWYIPAPYHYGYYWGPPSRPGLYGGGF